MQRCKVLKTCVYSIPVLLLLACVEPAARTVVQPDPVLFGGSTPCDFWIRNRLQVTDSAGCEFIKWEMKLFPVINDSGTFEMLINYGVSQPNTNGFKSGGKKVTVKGTYLKQSRESSDKTVSYLVLSAPTFPSKLYLVQISNSVYHFSDERQKLLVGNGGFGYVLNKIK